MRRGGGSSRLLRFALWLLGALIVLLGLAQLFLPKLAASRISSRVGRYGKVTSVHVSAWPAVKLLWHEADSVDVRAARLSLSPSQTAELLEESKGVSELDVRTQQAHEGPLPVSEVHLRKRGSELHASAFASTADVQAALPAGFDVQLLGSSEGKVEVRASGGLFGVGAAVNAIAEASDGKLVVHPSGLLAGFRLTLFSDPRVAIQSIGAHSARGADAASGYTLEASATLR
jgi:hypothetical protein